MDDITFGNFHIKLKDLYPELHHYIFRGRDTDAALLVRFIHQQNIPLVDGRIYVSYQDTWDYIIANEDMHEWWLL